MDIDDLLGDQDPGWAMRSGPDGLVTLRYVFAAFVVAVLVIAAPAVILRDRAVGVTSPALSVLIIAVAGVAALGAQRLIAPRLDCTTEETLAATYRSRFFLRLALAESPALIAFAVAISLGPWWVYFVGLAFALVGLWYAAPTKGRLNHDQRQLDNGGCAHRLVPAIRFKGLTDARR